MPPLTGGSHHMDHNSQSYWHLQSQTTDTESFHRHQLRLPLAWSDYQWHSAFTGARGPRHTRTRSQRSHGFQLRHSWASQSFSVQKLPLLILWHLWEYVSQTHTSERRRQLSQRSNRKRDQRSILWKFRPFWGCFRAQSFQGESRNLSKSRHAQVVPCWQ